MLNWRRDPDYEWRMNALEINIQCTEIDIQRTESDIEQVERETEQLKQENARERALSASIRRLCFPPESSSIPQAAIEPDCGPSSP